MLTPAINIGLLGGTGNHVCAHVYVCVCVLSRCVRVCLCVAYAWRSVYKGLCVSDYLSTHVCVSVYTSITCAPTPLAPGS